MKLGALYPSKYMKQDDLPNPAIGVISHVAVEEMQDGEPKPVVHYSNGLKPMVLNKGNGEMICVLYGDDTDGWAGKSIEIYADPTIMFGGKRTGGIRVRKPSGPPSSGMNLAQAIAKCAEVGISKDDLIKFLKDSGKASWNASCVPLVQDLIDSKKEEKFDAADPLAIAPDKDIPF